MIKAVLFDYGGVLSEGGNNHSIGDTIAALLGKRLAWSDVEPWHEKLRLGTIASDEFLRALGDLADSSSHLTVQDWNDASYALFVRSASVYDLAARLRAHGIRTGILSNVYPMTMQVLQASGSYEDFDPIVLSCEVHRVKPGRDIYQLALQKLGVQPGEVLFVDDQEKCLLPARELGMHTVLAESPGQIVVDVTALVKLENGIDI